jgi:hypothetical protein
MTISARIKDFVGGTNQWYNDLTIGMGFKMIWCLEALADESVIVYLPIDSECESFILVGEGLGSAVCDCERSVECNIRAGRVYQRRQCSIAHVQGLVFISIQFPSTR